MQSSLNCMPALASRVSALMCKYYVARHVHYAIQGDTVIFLDLRFDRYSMFLGTEAQAFQSMISARGECAHELNPLPAGNYTLPAEIYSRTLRELQLYGLLTDRYEDAASAPAHILHPQEDLVEYRDTTVPTLQARDVWRFFTSCVVTALRMRFVKIEATVRYLQHRKKRKRSGHSPDISQVSRITCIYRRLRPLFPRDFLCLFDSLSLVDFLARYNSYPDIVFAVRVDPWAAHCWVQYGTVALNQDIEETADYLPIMLV